MKEQTEGRTLRERTKGRNSIVRKGHSEVVINGISLSDSKIRSFTKTICKAVLRHTSALS